MNIPLSHPGEPIDPRAELAPGVYGYVIEDEGIVYIPMVTAAREGDGSVGRFLDSLPRDRTIRFPTVLSQRLAGMLERRGFAPGRLFDPQLGEWIDYMERQAAYSHTCMRCGAAYTSTSPTRAVCAACAKFYGDMFDRPCRACGHPMVEHSCSVHSTACESCACGGYRP